MNTLLSKEHRKWRLLMDRPREGAYNMAVDEAILISHALGEVPPTLRLYQWSPPAVSIGFSQNLTKEVDVKNCSHLGIDIVRRPTGGRAVLHDKELTYSVIIHTRMLPGSVLETYKFLSQGLLEAINLLGLTARIAPKPVKSLNPGSPSCFDSSSWYEIEVSGKKLVGSAQTRKKDVLLQHGAILMELDINKLLQVLAAPSEKVRQRLAAALKKQATAINPELLQLGRAPVQPDRVEQAVVEGFQAALGIALEPAGLTEREKNIAAVLAETKYAAQDWTLLRKDVEHHV